MAKKKKKKFRVHAVLEVDQDKRLELMFSSTLERVTIRAVVDGIPQRPYNKSSVFYDEQGAYLIVPGEYADEHVTYHKIYIDNFKRVRGL